MNPRDLPEVVSELIIEMHEVRSEIKEVRAELRGLRNDLEAMPDRISTAMLKTLEPFLLKIVDNDTLLKNHETRLGNLESPQ